MTWLLIALIVLLSFAAMVLVLKLPRGAWEMVGAALILGVVGYALQGHPGLAGSPKVASETLAGEAEALVGARQQLGGGAAGPNDWVIISDALARHGQFGDAAEMLRGAVAKDPKNAEAWLAMGNALVAHAEGGLTPAAFYAYQQAAVAQPNSPGPPFFLGLAMAQSGRLAEGRALWAGLLARAPKDAPWRSELEARLARLDAFIASTQSAPPTQP